MGSIEYKATLASARNRMWKSEFPLFCTNVSCNSFDLFGRYSFLKAEVWLAAHLVSIPSDTSRLLHVASASLSNRHLLQIGVTLLHLVKCGAGAWIRPLLDDVGEGERGNRQ